jgi:hypothetical protein
LTPKILLDFINAGGNILLTLSADSPTPTALVSLLLELDIHLPTDRNSIVVDHFNYDTTSAAEKHDVLLLPRPDSIRPDIKNFFKGDGKGSDVIAFPRGVGQTLGNDSPLLTPILRGPRTAYSYNPKDDAEGVEDPFAVGQQLSLITTMQARNSARFTVIGAVEMLENTWFDAKVKLTGKNSKDVKTSNQAFAKEVTGWTFNEIGVLKVENIEHSLFEGGVKSNVTNPKMYRVKNDVVSRMHIYSSKFANMTSPMKLLYQSTLGINGYHSLLQLVTRFNLNSLCSPPFTAWPLNPIPRPPLPHPHSTPPTSSYPISTAYTTLRSTTSDRSSPMLRRRTRSRSVILHMMNGHGAGSSAMPGHGFLVSESRSLDGWPSLRCGCGASRFH